MFSALLICSAEECAVLFVARGPLGELEALACDCGCGLQLLGPPEPVADEDRDGRLELAPLG